MDWDPIGGVSIRDTTDHVSGYILRSYGPMVFSALFEDGTVRYYRRGSDRFSVRRPATPL